MSLQASRSMRISGCAGLVASLLAVSLVGAGCNKGDDTASVTMTISLDGAPPAPVPGSSTNGSFGTSTFGLNAYTDVTRIRVDVKDAVTGAPWTSNFDLAKNELNQWTGTLPFLPKNKALRFIALATKDDRALFRGSTDQTLTGNNQVVTIALAPESNGTSVNLPRIRQITVPSDLESDQTSNISFYVEGNQSETLNYAVTAAANSGAFFPTSGAMTLAASSGTFVTQYSAPNVSTTTDLVHSVKVTNAAGNSVSTTFKIRVKPPTGSDGVRNTTFQVLFNPVIQHLASSRVDGTTDVLFDATVVDDKPASQLTYVWTFKPEGSTVAETLPSTGNRATLSNYSVALTGELVVAVTDSDGGTTTLKHTLIPNQFPDNPVSQGGTTGVNTIRAGENHVCALMNNGKMQCWGRNNSGQLGYGDVYTVGLPGTSAYATPAGRGLVPLLETETVSRLAVGGNHTCALLSSGLVRCWGLNSNGQLGLNSTTNVGDNSFVTAAGYVNLGGIATKIAAGLAHTCAIMENGAVRCWGSNSHGQLGIGNNTGTNVNIGDNEQPWQDVNLGGLTAKAITAGGLHSCALLDNGKVRCWGYGQHGQLGISNGGANVLAPSTSSADVPLGTVLQLSAGANHTCALLDTGDVRCWGLNNYGQLGIGSWTATSSPTQVNLNGAQVLQVATGTSHTCALLSNGAVKCWGRVDEGLLGYGGTPAGHQWAPPATSVDLGASATAYQITAGASNTCALLSNGRTRCWGSNTHGALGLGLGATNHVGDNETPGSVSPISLFQ